MRAYYYYDGSRFIVQYDNVERLTAGSLLTFQIILYPNGRIVYQYLSMTGLLNSATIGMQNATRDDGLVVSTTSTTSTTTWRSRSKTSRSGSSSIRRTERFRKPRARMSRFTSMPSGLEDGVHEANDRHQQQRSVHPGDPGPRQHQRRLY